MKTNRRDQLEVWLTPVMANLLWALLMFLVVPIPLAIVGLIGVMYRWMNERHTQVFSIFFSTIQQTWKKAYLLFLLDLAIGAFLIFNLLMFQVMDMGDVFAFLSRSVTILAVFLFVLFNVPAWVLISVWDKPLLEILRFVFNLIFAKPLWSIGIAVAAFFPFLITPIFPAAVLLTITGALAAYIASYGVRHLMNTTIGKQNFTMIEVQ